MHGFSCQFVDTFRAIPKSSPRTRKHIITPVPRNAKPADGYVKSIELALEHVNDPAWLGHNSPLAAPYFLGHGSTASDAASRGASLQKVLHDAIARAGYEYQDLLRTAFLDRDPLLNSIGLAARLNRSESTFFRHRLAAIDAVAAQVARAVSPSLRLALPAVTPLFGRDATIGQCQAALTAGHSVALTGPGGMGKSALAAQLASRWPLQYCFWYTVRPGLNDQLRTLMFDMAFFLRSRGQNGLWNQLVADAASAKPNPAIWIGLLRHDLAALPTPPLICIDEVDLLDRERPAHEQIAHLLDEIREHMPVMCIGQRVVIETALHVQLSGLDAAAIQAWLHTRGSTLAPAQMDQLLRATAGNPALLQTVFTLFAQGEPLDAELRRWSDHPMTLEPLLLRIWRRLSDDARALLGDLFVYRDPAPADAFTLQQSALDELKSRQLVLQDASGGVQLVHHAQVFVSSRFDLEETQFAHLQAAQVLEARGDATGASWHYVRAGHPALAAWSWLHHFETEVERGRADVARAMFAAIDATTLPEDDDRKALALLQTELAKRAAAPADMLAALDTLAWPRGHALSARARKLRGDALLMQGQADQALAAYRASPPPIVGSALRSELESHFDIGYVHAYLLGKPSLARAEASLMLIKAEEFNGMVLAEQGALAAAIAHYGRALALLPALPSSKDYEARLLGRIGAAAWRKGDLALAVDHLNRSLLMFEHMGSVVHALYARVNLSAAYVVAGSPALARDVALAGLQRAQAIQHPALTASLAVNAGEACYYLGDQAEAERLAQLSLRQEDEPNMTYSFALLGMVQLARGSAPDAAATFRTSVESARDVEDKFAEAHAQRWLARALTASGGDAAAAWDAAIALFESIGNQSESLSTARERLP